MIIYSEEKNGPQSVFIKTVTDESGTVTSVRRVSIPLYQITGCFLYSVSGAPLINAMISA